MDKKSDRRSRSIRSLWILTFGLMLIISIGVIGYNVFSNWRDSVRDTVSDLAGYINQGLSTQIDTVIQMPDKVNEVNGKIIENGVFNLMDETARDKFFVSVLSACSKYVYSFSFGSTGGEYYGARRNEKGEIEIMKNNASTGGESWYYAVRGDLTAGERTVNAGSFDPRTRAWYKAAAESGKPAYSPVYTHFVMNDLTVSAARPIYSPQGELLGVLGTHILLGKLGEQVAELSAQYQCGAYIIEKDTGLLIANSDEEANFTFLSDGTPDRKSVGDLKNTAVREVYDSYIGGNRQGLVRDGLYISTQEYGQNGLNWLVVASVPENTLTAELFRNIRVALYLAAAAFLLSLSVSGMAMRRLFAPMNDLVKKAEKLSAGELSQRVKIYRNDELGRISEAFNNVAEHLQRMINTLEETVAARTDALYKTNRQLEERQNRLSLILDSTAEAIYGTDRTGNCTFCNKSCLTLLGYTDQNELLGKNMHTLIHHSRKDGTPFPEQDCKILQAIRRGEGVYFSEDVLWRADGTCFDAEYRALPQFVNGKVVGAVLSFVDISERKRDEEQMRYLSDHDSMTGLMNRRSFENELKQMDREDKLPVSVIFIDLNGLKLVNDTFGHVFGDELIVKTAEALKIHCRPGDIAARVGGDEFVVLLPRTSAREARAIAGKLSQDFSGRKIRAIPCSMAVGTAAKTFGYQKIESVVETAENEMYKEKAVSRKMFGENTIGSILSALHEKNPIEKQHSEEVAALCSRIGTALGLPETEIRKLHDAGYLHDIGKIALLGSVLGKNPQSLTEAEREMVRQHPAVGYRILNLSANTLDLAESVYGHHERWNGSGYPKGLKGEEIPLHSRIIAVAEAYARIRNRHPKANSGGQALKILREGSGTQFDPKIVDALGRMLDESGGGI